eukprot:symbB.v1.2.025120.t1/scaffold2419.1/size79635/2
MRLWRRWLAWVSILAVVTSEEVMEDEGDELEETISKEKLRELHAKFDKNGDGKVSLEEVLEFANHMTSAIAGRDVKSILEEIDTDKDGKLSLQEHLNDLHSHVDGTNEEEMKELEIQKKLETEKFMAADTDNDQLLTLHEASSLFFPETNPAVLSVVVKETMKNRDKNGDGVLSFKEFSDPPEMEEAEGISVDTDEDKAQKEEEMKDFKRLDKDGDGMLNLEELKAWESGVFHTEAAMLRLIQTADKDGDMQATADELENAREELARTDIHDHLMEWADDHEL